VGLPVLMTALVTFPAHNAMTGLPPVTAGTVFWADSNQVQGLIDTGTAALAPPGTAAPKPLPHMVRGWPGLGAGTANSSS
jgi:hypothetical protein